MAGIDWIIPGAKVAEYNTYYHTATVTISTIEKLTATQVVLTNGHRYHRNKTAWDGGLKVVGSGQSELLPATDQRVRDAYARGKLRRLASDIDGLARQVLGNRAGVDTVLATLDQIAEAVDEARGKLAELEATP